MKRHAAILAALFTLIYLYLPVLGAFAQNTESDLFENAEAASSGVTLRAPFDGLQNEDLVSDYAELEEWLDDTDNSGKMVTFNDTITIPAGESLLIYDVTLDTANHGLVIEGNVRLTGVTITGEGVEKPVVTVKNGGWLDFGSGSPEITAAGLDGIGGCAVQVESGGTFNILMNGSCRIRSEGLDAVGVYSEGALDISDTFILSDGTGIVAGSEVKLFLCDIDAPVPIKTDNAVFLDTCIVSKPVENAASINRKVTGIVEEEGGISCHVLPVGGELPRHWFFDELKVALDNGREHTLPVSWDTSALDTNNAGEYAVTCAILAPYDRFRLDDSFPITVTIEVADTSLPVFYEAMSGRGSYYLYFLYGADDLSGLTLWRSDDDGESWYDYTETAKAAGMDVYGGELTLPFSGGLEHPALLMFEVEGLGESKILRIAWDEDDGYYTERGGDRNGLDRDGDDALPHNPEPNPNQKPDSNSEPEPETNPGPEPKREANSKSTRSSPRAWPDAPVTADTAPILPTPDEAAPPIESPVAAEPVDGISEQSKTASTPPKEWENDTTTAVSGKRLRMMAGAGSRVAFIKEDVRLSFASSELAALHIRDDQLFMVTVERLEELQYAIVASLDGAELENLSCSVTLDGKRHDISVSGTYDFAQANGEHEALPAQAQMTGTTAHVPLEAAGGEPEKRVQDTAEKPHVWRRLMFAVLGAAGVAGFVAATLKIRVKRHGR